MLCLQKITWKLILNKQELNVSHVSLLPDYKLVLKTYAIVVLDAMNLKGYILISRPGYVRQ